MLGRDVLWLLGGCVNLLYCIIDIFCLFSGFFSFLLDYSYFPSLVNIKDKEH